MQWKNIDKSQEEGREKWDFDINSRKNALIEKKKIGKEREEAKTYRRQLKFEKQQSEKEKGKNQNPVALRLKRKNVKHLIMTLQNPLCVKM